MPPRTSCFQTGTRWAGVFSQVTNFNTIEARFAVSDNEPLPADNGVRANLDGDDDIPLACEREEANDSEGFEAYVCSYTVQGDDDSRRGIPVRNADRQHRGVGHLSWAAQRDGAARPRRLRLCDL